MDPDDIITVAVYPGLGIARVGNSEDPPTIGPEVPGAAPKSDYASRDDSGRIRRQAARFRIYATTRSGEVRELTTADAIIEWRVQLANLKAGWYEFNNAMDLPANLVVPSRRRNGGIVGPDREQLDVRPGPITVSGPDQGGPLYQFRTGRFFGREVSLGGLATDEAGRLLVIPAAGVSAPRTRGTRPTTFANNELWHDDIADGPVRARVSIDGRTFEAKPGYVVTAPPNYAPGLVGVVTMDDVVTDLFARQLGWLEMPKQVSFSRHVWPIFDRLTGLQWVNHGAHILLGHGSPLDARDPAVIARLADAGPDNRAYRHRIFTLFRDPEAQLGRERTDALPPHYGDGYGEYVETGLADLPLTRTMFAALRAWSEGSFESDWTGVLVPEDLDALTPSQQCAALDRAGLHDCLGGPFHPGIELTWIMRRPELWEEPYRLKLAPEGVPTRQDYGDVLTAAACLAPNGPLVAIGPGALTRWLGIPWQTDGASCNSGREYEPSRYLSIPSFWGARVPNQVLSREAFERLSDETAPGAQRRKHFQHRHDWTRDINGRGYLDRIDNMVTRWWQIGSVVPVEGPKDASELGLPASPLHVECGRSQDFAKVDPTLALAKAIEAPESGDAAPPLTAEAEAPPADRQPWRRFGRGEV